MVELARRMKTSLHLVRESGRSFSRNRGALMAAALAFYTLLAVAPLVMVGLAIVGELFGTEAEREDLARGLGEAMGYEPSGTISDWLVRGSHSPGIVSAVAIAVALTMSTRLFAQVHSALNEIWGVSPERPDGFRARMREFLGRRLLAFGMVLGSGLLLLVLVIARGLSHAIRREHFETTSWTLTTVDVVQTVLSLCVVALISAVTYKVLPDRAVPWKSAWTGGALTSVLFNAGILFLGAYVGWITRTQSFGPAGAFVFLLVWLYYSAQAFILGAELSRTHARRHD